MPELARDFGLLCGTLEPGAFNTITDVPGVSVGHCTVNAGDVHTGVTAVIPQPGNLFRQKIVAAAEVINGFGKSVGLMQVNELGTLETPILLTNTFGVSACATALIRRAIEENPDIGRTTGTVNPVVMECNDGWLSDIQSMAITEDHASEALLRASSAPVVQGNVGAGNGMSCFGFKGGIGNSSRQIKLDGQVFHLGVLVQANFGRAGDLVLPDGRRAVPDSIKEPERGSVIIILATDIPLDHRQLRRVARRSGAGLARLGSFWGNGSGDIALAFSTANRIRHDEKREIISAEVLNEACIDILFQAAAEGTQEAVLNAMCAAEPMTGRGKNHRPSLAEWLLNNGAEK
ncbi:P1 family peptidase [Microvirga sp. W0021]|uniref:P1 family peptidase n=1 Tax=Hohaiivirga grylli TaxID=3133970 RepID=A0ABV0BMF6_9HYPH